MKIIGKFKRGFWFLTKYYFYLEDDAEFFLVEAQVDRKTWEDFEIGDYMDSHYFQFFKK